MVRALLIASVLPLTALYLGIILLVLDTDSAPGQYAVIIPISYLLGSIPWGFLLVQTFAKVDIRRYGSGRMGMANVLRTAGGRAAAAVLLLDGSKGALGVGLALAVADNNELALVAGGLAALAGHNWSIFLGLKGGRGVTTSVGGLLVMQPIAGAIAAAIFLPVTLVSRYFSVGSLTAVVAAFIATLVMALIDQSPYTYLLYTGPGGLVIIWEHRDNIVRLRQGVERRIGQPA